MFLVCFVDCSHFTIALWINNAQSLVLVSVRWHQHSLLNFSSHSSIIHSSTSHTHIHIQVFSVFIIVGLWWDDEHRGKAPADERTKDLSSSPDNELGLIPHQIRGFLSHYNNLLVTGLQYDKCVACSAPVLQTTTKSIYFKMILLMIDFCEQIINEYKKRGVEFLLEVLNKPTLLEDLTGLTQMKQEAAKIDVEWEVDSSNDDF